MFRKYGGNLKQGEIASLPQGGMDAPDHYCCGSPLLTVNITLPNYNVLNTKPSKPILTEVKDLLS